jgi:hypothetical protein
VNKKEITTIMSKWRVGDLAIIVRGRGQFPPHYEHFLGEICTLVDYPLLKIHRETYDWVVDIQGTRFVTVESCLKPIPPNDEVSNWDNIEKITGWKPKVFERVKK